MYGGHIQILFCLNNLHYIQYEKSLIMSDIYEVDSMLTDFCSWENPTYYKTPVTTASLNYTSFLGISILYKSKNYWNAKTTYVTMQNFLGFLSLPSIFLPLVISSENPHNLHPIFPALCTYSIVSSWYRSKPNKWHMSFIHPSIQIQLSHATKLKFGGWFTLVCWRFILQMEYNKWFNQSHILQTYLCNACIRGSLLICSQVSGFYFMGLSPTSAICPTLVLLMS